MNVFPLMFFIVSTISGNCFETCSSCRVNSFTVPSSYLFIIIRNPSYLYSKTAGAPTVFSASSAPLDFGYSITRTGFPTDSFMSSSSFLHAFSNTRAKSVALSYASWTSWAYFFFSSMSFGLKHWTTMASRMIPEPTPTFRSPKTVLAIYFASIPDAECNKSTTKSIFVPTVPFPTSSGIFFMDSTTRFISSFVANNPICFLSLNSSNAALPRSPVSLNFSMTASSVCPDAFATALIISWMDSPSSLES
jgi:hypothetical protein